MSSASDHRIKKPENMTSSNAADEMNIDNNEEKVNENIGSSSEKQTKMIAPGEVNDNAGISDFTERNMES
eukprot:CAMPEP_0172513298 /NCGR_PEP_ID=MMETSP1066-20121228/251512_1 /TAXON_ID=671091 /ORGANISM="Coscinodiscus wailesii, Strain CCMP2513" /LENGTH=69 /DNA_ID=CAMNT_0013293503 /DNA_START=43 /DNA_END=249 /DNA_ORIENTATION=+